VPASPELATESGAAATPSVSVEPSGKQILTAIRVLLRRRISPLFA
jgi:hypothetical protein